MVFLRGPAQLVCRGDFLLGLRSGVIWRSVAARSRMRWRDSSRYFDCMSHLHIPRVKPPPFARATRSASLRPPATSSAPIWKPDAKRLRRAGYQPFYFDSILDQDLYFAGSVERRARELEEMFARDEVRAIVCARGGYGSNYLLDASIWRRSRRIPKIFVGYSDVTVAADLFCRCGGLRHISWPHGGERLGARRRCRSAFMASRRCQARQRGSSIWATVGVIGLVEGAAEGILYGGCLSILVASLGTPYEIETEGTILFLEDVAAKPFQIDRMLMQLKLAGKLDDVRGIVFGEMLDCVQSRESGITLSRSCHADRGRSGSTGGLRLALRAT